MRFTSDDCVLGEVVKSRTSVSTELSCVDQRVRVFWSVEARPGDSWLRFNTSWVSEAHQLTPRYLLQLQMAAAAITHQGTVHGSPIISRDSLLFLGAEHPLSINGVTRDEPDKAVVGTSYLPSVQPGVHATGLTSAVGAVSERSQFRRDFLSYIEATRAHPSRPFLHYNSWFDFASWQEPNASFADRHMTETICIDRVKWFGKELVQKRGVQMDTFLLDDGWDDQKSLWKFNADTFPRGFDQVKIAAAEEAHAGVGVWISPWGGYGDAKETRIRAARAQGFETAMMEGTGVGFSLSGPKYYKRFCDIMLEMVRRYGVNMFKVDGIGFEGNHTTISLEMEGMLRLIAQLRADGDPALFVSLTTGTWPSPYWLQYGDSIWRGHGDLGLEGEGTRRQMWVTYRDAVVFHLVARRASLMPLAGLMLHGVVLGAVGQARCVLFFCRLASTCLPLGSLVSGGHFEDPGVAFGNNIGIGFAIGAESLML